MYYKDIHNHTNWSDGDGTVEMLLNRAREHHLQKIGISDHYEAIKHRRGYSKSIKDTVRSLGDIKVFIGIEVAFGSDTHSIEEDWWMNMVTAHDYLSNACKTILERYLEKQRVLEKKVISAVTEEQQEVYLQRLDEVNAGIDSLMKRLPVALEYCKVESIGSDMNKKQSDYYYASLDGGLRASGRCKGIEELRHIELYHERVDA